MTKNDHKWVILFPASPQPLFDEHRAYALTLSFGNNGHRRQSDACQFNLACFVWPNRHRAEEYVADDATIVFDHERNRRLAVLSKRVNQIGFRRTAERPLVDDSDRWDVFRLFRTNNHISLNLTQQNQQRLQDKIWSSEFTRVHIVFTRSPGAWLRLLVFFQLKLGDRFAVDFVRAVRQTQCALVRPGVGQVEVLTDAAAAMRL